MIEKERKKESRERVEEREGERWEGGVERESITERERKRRGNE